MATFLRNTSVSTVGLIRALKSPAFTVRWLSSKEDYKPDYYSALGVSKVADIKQIKLAYFRMAKKYHPVSKYRRDLKNGLVQYSGAVGI